MRDMLGAHVSIAGGLHRAFARGRRNDCSVIQIFTSSNMSWHTKEPTDEDVRRFRNAREQSIIQQVVAHDSYLVNLSSANAETAQRSLETLAAELTRCQRLGLEILVMHPGAHTGAGLEPGLRAVTHGIDEAIERTGTHSVRILLETTAGSGTVLGYRFEQLARIIETSRQGGQLGVCLDTAHVFAAGYDLRTQESFDRVMEEFDRVIGLGRLGCFHLNDSKAGFAARVDRHEHIGKGELGLEPFRHILNDPRFAGVPKVIETPRGTWRRRSWDRINLATLRSLVEPGVEFQREGGEK